jgi:hypothetical protein
MRQLKERDRLIEVLQSMRADVQQRRFIDRIPHQVGSRRGQEYLAAVGRRRDTGSLVYGKADVVLGHNRNLPGVEPHPHTHFSSVLPRVARKFELRRKRGVRTV